MLANRRNRTTRAAKCQVPSTLNNRQQTTDNGQPGGTACLTGVSCPLLCCTLFNVLGTWQILPDRSDLLPGRPRTDFRFGLYVTERPQFRLNAA
jgi:hypothetical protein